MMTQSAELEYCKTDDQAADIFTKALPPQKWGPALRLLGIRTGLQSELRAPTDGAAPSCPT
jgi:hypothetical protein